MSLTDFLEEFKVQQAELEQRAGIGKKIINQYTTGQKTPSKGQLKKLTLAANQMGEEMKNIEIIEP